MSEKTEHSTRKHALLSASGASRWIACTPSARMEEEFADQSSDYAAEGTLAHEFADLELRLASHVGGTRSMEPKKSWIKELKQLRKSEYYTDEMEEQVKKYTDYVLEEWLAAKKETPDSVLAVEEKLDYSYLVEEGFGTSDANIIGDGVLEVTDLKYGKGVKVNASKNAQLRLYGIGSLRKYDLLYDIHTVKMTIVQPRLDHIDSETLTVEELLAWAEEEVRPAAKKAYAGEGDCVTGDHCRFCKAKPRCTALAAKHLGEAKEEFQVEDGVYKEPKLLTDSELIQVFEAMDSLVSWSRSISSYVLKEALGGKSWEGYKLVEGRSNRRWLDEEKAKFRILDLSDNLEEEQILNTKLKGLTDIEKLLGKVKFAEIAKDLVIKPQGAPTLVPDSDKRPAMGIEQAKKDFE